MLGFHCRSPRPPLQLTFLVGRGGARWLPVSPLAWHGPGVRARHVGVGRVQRGTAEGTPNR
eukprot:10584718-Alexandrium_andersonii.AAC.1